MAIPTAPTAATIVTEALTRYYNGATPSTAEVTRATSYGLEKVKRDIMLIGKKWRPLATVSYDITVDGVSKYALPSDYEAIIGISILDGIHTDALTAVDNTSKLYTLATDEDISQDAAEGAYLLITAGTGVNQMVQIDDYDTTTKVATGSEAYSTAPVATDTYLIVDAQYELSQEPIYRRDNLVFPVDKGRPSTFFINPDSTYGHVELYKCPDDIYGVQVRYYADLLRVDITGTLYSTLLRRWAGVLEQGVYVWKLGEDDDRYEREFRIYDAMLRNLAKADLEDYYNPNLQIQVNY